MFVSTLILLLFVSPQNAAAALRQYFRANYATRKDEVALARVSLFI